MASKKSAKKNDKRSLIEKANSHLFIAVIIASVVVSFSIVLLKFLNDTRTFQDRVITVQENTRDTLDQNITNAKEIEDSFKALETTDVDSQIVLDALPSSYDYPALVTSFEKLAKIAKVSLTNISGTDSTAQAINSESNPKPVAMDLSVDVEGSYKQIQKFVDVLEDSIRPFRINSTQMSGDDSSMTATFDITSYYQPARDLQLTTEKVQ